MKEAIFVADGPAGAGTLAAFISTNARRRLNGVLSEPVQLFGFIYNIEMDRTELHPISWEVGCFLAPERMERLSQALRSTSPVYATVDSDTIEANEATK